MNNKSFEKRLIELRQTAKLSQSELAERLNVSRQAISRWESGDSLPSVDNLVCMSELYGVSVDYLLKGEQTEHTEIEQESCEPAVSQAPSAVTHKPRVRVLLISGILCAVFVITLLLLHVFRSAKTPSGTSPVEGLVGEAVELSPENTFTLE